jgi:hypothetical protein
MGKGPWETMRTKEASTGCSLEAWKWHVGGGGSGIGAKRQDAELGHDSLDWGVPVGGLGLAIFSGFGRFGTWRGGAFDRGEGPVVQDCRCCGATGSSRSGHPWRDLFLNEYRKGCACQLDRTKSRRPSSEELTGEVAQNAKTAAIARAAREEAWVHFGGNAGARLLVDDNQSDGWPWRGSKGRKHRPTKPFPRRGGGVELQKR